MSGYQSDVNLQSVNYGVTQGATDNYNLDLPTAITAYEEGLSVWVRFHVTNTGHAQISVNGLGLVPVMKITGNELAELEAEDIDTQIIYILIYDGAVFQVHAGGAETPEGPLVLKGSIDASTFPPFPAAKKGDFYTITGDGYIGDSDGGAGLQVITGDVVYATEDNDGGFYVALSGKWNALAGRTEIET